MHVLFSSTFVITYQLIANENRLSKKNFLVTIVIIIISCTYNIQQTIIILIVLPRQVARAYMVWI